MPVPLRHSGSVMRQDLSVHESHCAASAFHHLAPPPLSSLAPSTSLLSLGRSLCTADSTRNLPNCSIARSKPASAAPGAQTAPLPWISRNLRSTVTPLDRVREGWQTVRSIAASSACSSSSSSRLSTSPTPTISRNRTPSSNSSTTRGKSERRWIGAEVRHRVRSASATTKVPASLTFCLATTAVWDEEFRFRIFEVEGEQQYLHVRVMREERKDEVELIGEAKILVDGSWREFDGASSFFRPLCRISDRFSLHRMGTSKGRRQVQRRGVPRGDLLPCDPAGSSLRPCSARTQTDLPVISPSPTFSGDPRSSIRLVASHASQPIFRLPSSPAYPRSLTA